MALRADYSQNLGMLPDPCPACGRKALHQSTTDPLGEEQRVITVRRCRFCKAEWHNGERIAPRWVP